MNLVTRFLAARRDKLLMRFSCWLVCFSLVLGLMLPQQRAEALVAELTMASVASVAAAYLCACGLPFVTQGMDKDALVSSVQRLIQEFLDTELGGISVRDWLGNIWNLTVIAGKILLGRPLTNEFAGFAQWVAQKYAVQPGENAVYGDHTVTFADGSFFALGELGTCISDDSTSFSAIFDPATSKKGSPIPFGSDSSHPHVIEMVSGKEAKFYYGNFMGYKEFLFRSPYSSWTDPFGCIYHEDKNNFPFFALHNNCLCVVYDTRYYGFTVRGYQVFGELLLSAETASLVIDGSSLSIDRAPSMSYIPEGIAAEQGIALDVGAAATMNPDLVLQGVLDDVIAGELTSTMTAAEEGVENPPVEEELPDVSELGLPALGQALTSRFPFSIPWDFFRAVQLLAVPAKAPYFEVDFMEPLADDVGGWNGSTTVVLDFSEYAIIGQVSRWTSTIGFCLMLAGATKRLIWTA